MPCKQSEHGSDARQTAPFAPGNRVRILRVFAPALAVILIAVLLTFLPSRAEIPPLVEPDYCYQLIASERLLNGQGLTAPMPAAPGQPWTWEYDFAFLTQWPAGYSLLVFLIRWILNVPLFTACRGISVVACAVAIVGWFEWTRRIAGNTLPGLALSAAAAASAVSVGLMLNPSTDLLLVAALPWVMALLIRSFDAPPLTGKDAPPLHGGSHSTHHVLRSLFSLALAGLCAGALCWLRYAALFVPAAMAMYLFLEWRPRRTNKLPHLFVFLLCAALPVLMLVGLNRTLGPSHPLQQQLNLGSRLELNWQPELLYAAWQRFTDLGYYDHRAEPHVVLMLWPLVAIAAFLTVPSIRRALTAQWETVASPRVGGVFQRPLLLSGVMIATCLTLIVTATLLFSEKFNYVGLDRYYFPIRPLYIAVFAAPFALLRSRVVRVVVFASALLAVSWSVQQDWQRDLARAHRPRNSTPLGQWATCFNPNAAALYQWLKTQPADQALLISNYPEYVALETGHTAAPPPKSRAALNQWLSDAAHTRGVPLVRPIFVLDSDNGHRDYWMPDIPTLIKDLGLIPGPHAPDELANWIYEMAPPDDPANHVSD